MKTNEPKPADGAAIKAVLLDMDGTLIDSNDAHAQAWAEGLREFGHPVPVEQVLPQIGKGSDQLMPVFLSKQEIDDFGEAFDERCKAIFNERFLPHLKAFPGARELVQRLQASGYQAILASSAGEDQLEDFKRIAGIDDLIERSVSKSDASHSKPYPDIFQAALAQAEGVTAAEAVVLGDTPWDAEAARNAHLRCVGVLSGGSTEAELRKAGCLAVYRDVAELVARYDTTLFGQTR